MRGRLTTGHTRYLPRLSTILLDFNSWCNYKNFDEIYLHLLGQLLIARPDLSIRLWPEPNLADLEALYNQVCST